ncbi:MAG: DNA primase [Actinobacteria bacterium]|nr:DNA primase [Actinomycetota bacterium]
MLPSAPEGYVGIQDDDIAAVRNATDIVAVISEHVQLKRVGRRWQGLCPFHQEKSGSFSVNAEEKLYYCFGCGAKGDVITFVREVEHLDFVGAVEKLASKSGVTLRYTDEVQNEGRKRRTKLLDAVTKASAWYHDRLLSSPDAAAARGYLRSRGLDGDDVRTFGIGWAPEGWDELARALKVPDDVFVEAGLGFINSRNRPTDAFRGRIIFPIHDVAGATVGFGGRIMPGVDGAKYKNSSDSAIYGKSKLLYGLHMAKADIVKADEAIICEGYTDVIGFFKAGMPRAVATCGTALTEDHVKLLRSFAQRVVLAFDADAAGQNAAARVYTWEKKYDLDVAVAVFPGGVDPAELAQSDPEGLAAAIAEAKPFLKFRLDRVLDSSPLDTPEHRARAADAAMAVILEHPSDIVRDQYLLEVAARLRLDPDQLRNRRPAPASGGPAGSGPGSRGNTTADRPQRESRPMIHRDTAATEALRHLIWDPGSITPLLDEVLFPDRVAATAYRALRATSSVADAIEMAAADDPVAGDLLQRLAVEEPESTVQSVLIRLVDDAANASRAALQAEARVASDPFQVGEAIRWLNLRIMDLREQEGSLDLDMEAMYDLLAWLTEAEVGTVDKTGATTGPVNHGDVRHV